MWDGVSCVFVDAAESRRWHSASRNKYPIIVHPLVVRTCRPDGFTWRSQKTARTSALTFVCTSRMAVPTWNGLREHLDNLQIASVETCLRMAVAIISLSAFRSARKSARRRSSSSSARKNIFARTLCHSQVGSALHSFSSSNCTFASCWCESKLILRASLLACWDSRMTFHLSQELERLLHPFATSQGCAATHRAALARPQQSLHTWTVVVYTGAIHKLSKKKGVHTFATVD